MPAEWWISKNKTGLIFYTIIDIIHGILKTMRGLIILFQRFSQAQNPLHKRLLKPQNSIVNHFKFCWQNQPFYLQLAKFLPGYILCNMVPCVTIKMVCDTFYDILVRYCSCLMVVKMSDFIWFFGRIFPKKNENVLIYISVLSCIKTPNER